MTTQSKVDVVIAGHSHTCAFGVPLGDHLTSFSLLPLTERENFVFYGLLGAWPRQANYWDEVNRLAEGRTILFCWEGNQHLAAFLFEPSPPFDFVLSEQPNLPLREDVMLVPEAMVREYFRLGMVHLRALLQGIISGSNPRFILIGTPPPKRDETRLRDFLSTEPPVVGLATARGFSIETVPFTSGFVRLKLWHIIQSLMRETAQDLSVPFLEVPERVRDSDGFLREEYWANDVTHANLDYGAVMIDYFVQEHVKLFQLGGFAGR